jgi:hypothetical protein
VGFDRNFGGLEVALLVADTEMEEVAQAFVFAHSTEQAASNAAATQLGPKGALFVVYSKSK